MKFLADENIDRALVLLLRKNGYQVLDIKEISPGIEDEKVLNLANSEEAILLTEDKDFGELVFRLKLISQGVVLIRLNGWDSEKRGKRIIQVIQQYQASLWQAFTVIDHDKVRIRKSLL
ncbi:MAG: DUF5615 family PIN-like protein [Bacteroidota bacterium]